MRKTSKQVQKGRLARAGWRDIVSEEPFSNSTYLLAKTKHLSGSQERGQPLPHGKLAAQVQDCRLFTSLALPSKPGMSWHQDQKVKTGHICLQQKVFSQDTEFGLALLAIQLEPEATSSLRGLCLPPPPFALGPGRPMQLCFFLYFFVLPSLQLRSPQEHASVPSPLLSPLLCTLVSLTRSFLPPWWPLCSFWRHNPWSICPCFSWIVSFFKVWVLWISVIHQITPCLDLFLSRQVSRDGVGPKPHPTQIPPSLLPYILFVISKMTLQ